MYSFLANKGDGGGKKNSERIEKEMLECRILFHKEVQCTLEYKYVCTKQRISEKKLIMYFILI